jgi:hypothetical protein
MKYTDLRVIKIRIVLKSITIMLSTWMKYTESIIENMLDNKNRENNLEILHFVR